MHMIIKVILLILVTKNSECIRYVPDYEETLKWPTVAISVLVRNQAHTLPYFISCLNRLDYPKDRLFLWFYTDHNQDNSLEILENILAEYMDDFHDIRIINNYYTTHFSDPDAYTSWTPEHYDQVIKLREKSLELARQMFADYLFTVDADVYLTNPVTLKSLVKKQLDVTAPMLISDGLYSNFWCGITDKYYFERTDNYTTLLFRKAKGCFAVPMIHSAVLIDLRTKKSDILTYDPMKAVAYEGPKDDVITFASNARKNGFVLNVCNDHFYGYMQVPLELGDDMRDDLVQLLNIKTEAISNGVPLPLDSFIGRFVKFPTPSKLGVDAMYMINLERRKERRKLMELSFKELGMNVTRFEAIDGRFLNVNTLQKNFIKMMPNYEDPYHKRPMKTGEVGCFLSHFRIWWEIVDKKHAVTLVLEDDIHFAPYFRHRFTNLLKEIKTLDWDFVYIGRKALQEGQEVLVKSHVTKPLYSYWTLGYLISQRGAAKLIKAKPERNLLPVDEFLPIMFNEHPNETWKSYFPQRDLLAFSASPLLVEPSRYSGDAGYVSDTEDSEVVATNRRPPRKRDTNDL